MILVSIKCRKRKMQRKEKEKYTVDNARSEKQNFVFPALLKENSLKKKKKINRYITIRRYDGKYEKEYRTIVWQKNDEPYNTSDRPQNCLLIDDGSN